MKKFFKKLNQKGFGHHLIIPVIVIVAVAGVGTYILRRSHAEELTSVSSSLTNSNSSVPVFITDNGHFFRVNSDGSSVDNAGDKKVELLRSDGSSLLWNASNKVGFGHVDSGTPARDFSKIIGETSYDGAAIYDVTSKTMTQLKLNSSSVEGVASPTFSPDGHHILYLLQHSGTVVGFIINEIYTANADGTNIKGVRTLANYAYPLWQPGLGQRVSYLANVFNGNSYGGEAQYTPYVHIMDSNGQNDVKLGQPSKYVGDTSKNEGGTAWSYDGSKFAYIDVNDKLNVVTSAGKPIIDLNLGENKLNLSGSQIAFSPPSFNSIVFTDAHGYLRTINLSNGTISTVAKTNCMSDVAWLKDGRIIYDSCSGPSGSQNIKTIAPNGTTTTVYTSSTTTSDFNYIPL